ncbi:MAG TPA: VWA domain-containing protein [Pyrinomonadaceae bacterium]|jgi:VWFA-related protein|nr:VWA domain-containing protein [Pyrinomonadaceae bacterium]
MKGQLGKRTGKALSLLLFICLFSGGSGSSLVAQNPADQDDEVIRVDTDLTNLFFTVTNKQKAFVTTLREEDLRIIEDGVPQKILTFQRETDRPLSIAFLIDVSISEERTLPQEKAAARTFIEKVIHSSKDQAAIIPFTGAAFLEQGLTRDVLSIYRALERVDVALPAYLGSGKPISGIASGPGMKAPGDEGSTAIWDAIAVTASEVLARSSDPKVIGRLTRDKQSPASARRETNQAPTQRRNAIILLTDGQDTTSRVLRSEAINRALAAETVIYAIGIGDKKYGVDQSALNNVATATGGRAFFPKRDTDLTDAFAEIEQELRSQYLIAYSPSNKNRDGSYRQMQIEITNPELQKEQLKFRHRPGYFAKVQTPGR